MKESPINSDLYGFNDEIPILSGSADNVEILHQIMAEHGKEPKQWYQPFIEALQVKRAEKRRS